MIQNSNKNNIRIRLRVVQNCYVQRPQVKLLEYVLKTKNSFINDFCDWHISPYMPFHPDGWTITRRDDYLVELIVHDNKRVYELIEVLKMCQTVFTVKTQITVYFFNKKFSVNKKFLLFFYFWVLNTKLYYYLNNLYLKKIKKNKLKKINNFKNKRAVIPVAFTACQKKGIFRLKNKKTCKE